MAVPVVPSHWASCQFRLASSTVRASMAASR